MGVNTIIMMNQQKTIRKGTSHRSTPDRPQKKWIRIIIDQMIWWATLVLLTDMALKSKRKRLTAWWADKHQ